MPQLIIAWLILMSWIYSESHDASRGTTAFVAALGTACLAVVGWLT